MSDSERILIVKAEDGVTVPASMLPVSEPLGLVLLLHGISVDRHEHLGFYDDLQTSLAEQQFATVRLDFRGHGVSETPQEAFDVVSQIEDTLAVLRAVGPEYEQLPLHIVATSFGAPAGIYVARLRSAWAHSLFMIAPVLDYHATFLRDGTAWARTAFSERNLEAAEEDGHLLLDDFKVSRRLIHQMSILRPYQELAILTCRCHVYHGAADSMVSVDISRRHCSEDTKCTLHDPEGVEHGFVVKGDDQGSTAASRSNKFRLIEEIVQFVSQPRDQGR